MTSDINLLFQLSQDLISRGKNIEALKTARLAALKSRGNIRSKISLSGILIDAGSALNSIKHVKEGVNLLESIKPFIKRTQHFAYHYNIGTGYLTLGQKERGFGVGTKPSLSKAIDHFDESLRYNNNYDARVNLAIALIDQGRSIEALDELEEVISQNPNHHVAIANRAKALVKINNWIFPHNDLEIQALIDYKKAALLAKDDISYLNQYIRIMKDFEKDIKIPKIIYKNPNQIEKLIWENRLSLNPCPLCNIESPKSFDVYTLHGRLSGPNRRPSSEEVDQIVNSLHRNYSSARYCLLQAINAAPFQGKNQIILMPTPSFSNDSIENGLIIMSFLGFYSILSQISYAMNSYFHLNHNELRVKFNTIWGKPNYKKKSIPLIRSEIHPSLKRIITPSLSALYRLALSLEIGLGRYSDLRILRNNLEHHVVILSKTKRNSRFFKDIDKDELLQKTIKIAIISKAALWYFCSSIWKAEYERLKKISKKGKLVVNTNVKIVKK